MTFGRGTALLGLIVLLTGCGESGLFAWIFPGKCPVPKGETAAVPDWFLGPWVLDVKTPDEQYTAVWRVQEGDNGVAIFEESAQSVSTRRPIPVTSAALVKDRLVIDIKDDGRFGPDGSGVYVFKRVAGVAVPTLTGCYKFKIVTQATGGKPRTQSGDIVEMKRATFGTLYDRTQ